MSQSLDSRFLGWFLGVPLVTVVVLALGHLLGGAVFWSFLAATGGFWITAVAGLCFALPSLRQNGCMVSVATLAVLGGAAYLVIALVQPRVEPPPRSSDHLLVYPRLDNPLLGTVDGVRLRMTRAEVEALLGPPQAENIFPSPSRLEGAPPVTVHFDEEGLVDKVQGACLRAAGRVLVQTGMSRDKLFGVESNPKDLGQARLLVEFSGHRVQSVGLEYTPADEPDRGAYLLDRVSLEFTPQEVTDLLGPPRSKDAEGFTTYTGGTGVRFDGDTIREIRGWCLSRPGVDAPVVRRGDRPESIFKFFGWKNVTGRRVFRYPGLEMHFDTTGPMVRDIRLKRVAYP